MKKFTLLLIFSWLSIGCTGTTQLHLFAKHLSAEQTQNIANKLDKSMFKVNVNQQAFPAGIGSNTLVYAPTKGIRNRLEQLIIQLAAAGFDVANTDLLMANNHSFTENNIGVYLIPEGVALAQPEMVSLSTLLPVINDYSGVDCQHATTLALKDDQTFVIEVNRWQADIEDYQQDYHTGRWQLLEGNLLTLNSARWQQSLSFQRSEFERQEIDAHSKGVLYIPTKRLANDNPLVFINCRYSISIALE